MVILENHSVNSKLFIADIRLWLKVGCSEEEQLFPTCISIDIEMLFNTNAVHSDDLKETVCYAKVVKRVSEFCLARSFHLIEYIAGSVHRVVQDMVEIPVEKITIKVTKLVSPIENIHGGVSFVYSK